MEWIFPGTDLLKDMNKTHFNDELEIRVPADPLFFTVKIGIRNPKTKAYCHAVDFMEYVDSEIINELLPRLQEWYPRAKKALDIE